MNWIGKAIGKNWSHGDLVTLHAYRRIAADATVKRLSPDGIFRCLIWAPTGNFAVARTAIASIDRTDTGAMSRRVTGRHRFGIIYEFKERTEKLTDDSPSADSVLMLFQRILESELLTDENGLRLVIGKPEFETIASNPRAILDSKGESLVAHYVGLEVAYNFSDSYPARMPLRQ